MREEKKGKVRVFFLTASVEGQFLSCCPYSSLWLRIHFLSADLGVELAPCHYSQDLGPALSLVVLPMFAIISLLTFFNQLYYIYHLLPRVLPTHTLLNSISGAPLKIIVFAYLKTPMMCYILMGNPYAWFLSGPYDLAL